MSVAQQVTDTMCSDNLKHEAKEEQLMPHTATANVTANNDRMVEIIVQDFS